MSKSLQDQLLSLGLAKSRPKPKPKKQQTRKPPSKGKRSDGSGKPNQSELTLEQAYRLREKQTREQAEQARERKRAADRKRRELNQKIRAIVEPNRLNDAEAELTRNFLYKGRIRKVNVSAEQLKALNSGELGIVYLSGGYHLLTAENVGQVRSLSTEHVPDLSGSEIEEEEFPVPDDLLW